MCAPASICMILTEIIINVLEKFIDFLDFSIRLYVGYINAGWNLLQLVGSSTFNVSDLYASVSVLVIIIFLLDCNTPKYTQVVFDMFRVFSKPNLTVS